MGPEGEEEEGEGEEEGSEGRTKEVTDRDRGRERKGLIGVLGGLGRLDATMNGTRMVRLRVGAGVGIKRKGKAKENGNEKEKEGLGLGGLWRLFWRRKRGIGNR